jgi:hypothetical protein
MNSKPNVVEIYAPPAPADAIAAFKQFAARPPRSTVSRPRCGQKPRVAKFRKKQLARLLRERGVKSVAALATNH